MNWRILYIVFVVVFVYLLFYEWSKEEQVKSDLVAANRVSLEGGVEDEVSVVALESDGLKVSIEPLTGAIVGVELKKYPVLQSPESPSVRVLGSKDGFRFYIKSGFKDLVLEDLKIIAQDQKELILGSEDGSLRKKYYFKGEYGFVVEDSYGGLVGGDPYVFMYRTDGKPLDSRSGFFEGSSYVGVAFNTPESPYENYRLGSIDNSIVFNDQLGGWVGFIQKYFLSAIIFDPSDRVRLLAQPPENKQGGLYALGGFINDKTALDKSGGIRHEFFFGPKVRSDLMAVSKDLELTIDMGWFWFLAQPLMMLLVVINGLVSNWGVAIILLTLIVKVLLWPLSSASFRSMARMRAVQPQLKEIQDRYKNDRQKLGMEMMALYKKEKINPAGGCFPMLLQFPVFIALFFALREAVELRHAPFFFWLTDLSAPDPLFILPISMAVLMYLTQKLNPQPPNMDPMQANMLKFMPVAISVLFIFLPSGLVLYSVANAAISLVQQKLLYKKHGADSSGP
tara:strand:+ start:21375 stop:22901 length:1527 start_codon:yes stop_codon:yes gene_type:complete